MYRSDNKMVYCASGIAVAGALASIALDRGSLEEPTKVAGL